MMGVAQRPSPEGLGDEIHVLAQRALEGLKVVEYGEFVSAPYCGKLLADLGAEVIKVENPAGGDESRHYGPFRLDEPDAEASGVYAYLNTNKLGVTLNPESPTGTQLFRKLLVGADVLLSNQQPGVLEELGLTYEALSKNNPRLVMTSVSVFGKTGPYNSYRGYDLTGWHGSGIGHQHLGYPEREPIRGSWRHADHWGAISAATATMLALHAREVTGQGQYVDVSETDVLACMIMGYQKVTVFNKTGEWGARTASRHERDPKTGGGNAPSGLFACKGGFVFIFAFEEHHWNGLVKAMGDPDWAKDPIFQGPSWERAKYGSEILELMTPWLDSHTNTEIFEACQANRVPSGPVYSAMELLENQHLASRKFFVEMESPAVGRVKVPGRSFSMSETPATIERPAPLLGQHNDEVYGRLGFRAEDLSELRRAGVI